MNRPQDIQEQLSAYVDGQLNDEEARQVEQAIGADQTLARDLAAIRATRDVLRAEQALSPPPDFVDRVLAEARRRNLIPAPPPAVQSAGQAAAQPAGPPPAPKRWRVSWQARLAAAASLVLAAAAGGTVAVLYWTNYPPTTPPAAATADARNTPTATADGGLRQPAAKLALREERFRKTDERLAYAEKDLPAKQIPAEPAPEAPASPALRSALADAKDKFGGKEAEKNGLYYANAKAIVRDLAGESSPSDPAGRRGGAAKNSLGDSLMNVESAPSAEIVQKLDLHVTHLAAARREVAAILTTVASPDAPGGPAKSHPSANGVNVALAGDLPAERPAGSVRPGADKPNAGGAAPAPKVASTVTAAAPTPSPAAPSVSPERTAAPTATPMVVAVAPARPASPPAAPRPAPVAIAGKEKASDVAGTAGGGIAMGAGTGGGSGYGGRGGHGVAGGPAITDRTAAPVALGRANRIDQADKYQYQPATSPAQRASALASLRGMACDGSAGTGVWKFVIVDTPERIERISQAVRRVGVPDKDVESGQQLCLAEPEPSQTRPTAPPPAAAKPAAAKPAATKAGPPAKGLASASPRLKSGGQATQAQSAPYYVAEIQRRPEPRAAEPLRLLIITLRAEPVSPTSNADPTRNMAK
jgi:anti-sigma factor RsiW